MAKAKTVTNDDLKVIDISTGQITRAKLLENQVEVVIRIGGRDYSLTDKVNKPAPSFRTAMGDLSEVCRAVFASDNPDDAIVPYAFVLGYDADGQVQSLKISAKIHLAPPSKVQMTLTYPELAPASEGVLHLAEAELKLVAKATKEALAYACGKHMNMDLFNQSEAGDEEAA